jgi:hypothetical protein
MREFFHKPLSITVWIRASDLALYKSEMTAATDYKGELIVHDPFVIPDRFDLLFSPTAQSWRRCVVVERRSEAKSIVILFIARHLA